MESSEPKRSSKPKRRLRKLGCLVVLLLSAAVLLAVAVFTAGPSVPKEAALLITLTGDPPATERPALERLLLGAGNPAVPALFEGLSAAQADERIKLVVLELPGGGLSLAQADEIRGMLNALKKKKKKIILYANDLSLSGYLAGCPADAVYLNPAGSVRLAGLSLDVFLLGDLLRKCGVSARLVREGRYKTAFEVLSRNELSPESRMALEELLDSIWPELLDWIAAARKVPRKRIESLVDRGVLTAKEALGAGLVDGTCWRFDLKAICRKVASSEVELLTWENWRRSQGTPKGAQVAYFPLTGMIAGGLEGPANLLAADKVVRELERLRETTEIKGVILRVDSPGGDALASARLYREVARLAEAKPVVVSMGEVAASGGYYLAAGASSIVTHSFTLTGSIGVFGGKLDLRGALEKLGVKVESFSRGKYGGLYDPFAPPVEGEQEVLAKEIRWIYERFVGDVALGRRMQIAEVKKAAEGRLWSGKDALRLNLVDRLGGLAEAVQQVKTLANISGPVRLVRWPPGRKWYDLFLGSGQAASSSALFEKLFSARVFALCPYFVMWN